MKTNRENNQPNSSKRCDTNKQSRQKQKQKTLTCQEKLIAGVLHLTPNCRHHCVGVQAGWEHQQLEQQKKETIIRNTFGRDEPNNGSQFRLTECISGRDYLWFIVFSYGWVETCFALVLLNVSEETNTEDYRMFSSISHNDLTNNAADVTSFFGVQTLHNLCT